MAPTAVWDPQDGHRQASHPGAARLLPCFATAMTLWQWPESVVLRREGSDGIGHGRLLSITSNLLLRQGHLVPDTDGFSSIRIIS